MTDEQVTALRAVAHPVRLRMLSLLTGTAMSAAELARALDLTHANASYHLRALVAAGEVVEAGEERIRGGVAKRYRYPHEGPHRSTPATTQDHVAYAKAVGLEAQRRMHDRDPVRREGLPGGQLSDLEGWFAEDAWRRACALLEEASRLLHDANRPPATPGTVHANLSLLAFRMAQSPAGVEAAGDQA